MVNKLYVGIQPHCSKQKVAVGLFLSYKKQNQDQVAAYGGTNLHACLLQAISMQLSLGTSFRFYALTVVSSQGQLQMAESSTVNVPKPTTRIGTLWGWIEYNIS